MQKIAKIFTKIIDFFYHPFQKLCPIDIFRYAFCGGGNMILDWLLYFILYNFVIGHNLLYFSFCNYDLCITPHIATLCIVFPITLFTGFWLNRNVTFTQSSLVGWRQLLRYIMIVIINLIINYIGLKICVELWGWYPTPSKMAITLLTILISFFSQKYFSFRK